MIKKNVMKLAILLIGSLVSALFFTTDSPANDIDFVPSYIADGWRYDPQPFAIVPYLTAAIAFDRENNLYATNLLEEYYGDTITVYKYAAPEYDFGNPSVYVSYPKIFDTTSGIDFDGKGNLFVSEIIQSDNPTAYEYPDAGLIRMISANSLKLSEPIKFIGIQGIPGELGDFRATGLAAVGKETIYFPGRKYSIPTWGNIYMIDRFKKYVPGTQPSIVRPDLVMYAIADDKWEQIFVALTSIFARNPYTQEVVTIASFNSPKYVEELAFDSDGNLYALEGDDNPGPYKVEILKIIPPQIIISGCNTGIIDWPMQDGTTIGGILNENCQETSSHIGFVSCVVRHAVGFMRDGFLSPKQMVAIINCAAHTKE